MRKRRRGVYEDGKKSCQEMDEKTTRRGSVGTARKTRDGLQVPELETVGRDLPGSPFARDAVPLDSIRVSLPPRLKFQRGATSSSSRIFSRSYV